MAACWPTPAVGSDGYRRTVRFAAASIAILLPSVLTASLATATDSVYDPGRVLQHHDNECLGQKPGNCITVASPRSQVPKGSAVAITVACTRTFPHLVGWDSRQHEHIRLALLSTPPAERVGAAAAARDELKVVATSNANAPGYVTLYAGCSRKPWAGTPFMSSSEGVPGNHVGFTGAPR